MILSDRITQLRKKTGKSQKQFAESIGVDVSKYNKWENGKNAPDYDTVCMLADVFNTTTDYLLGRDVKDTLPNTDVDNDTKDEIIQLNAAILDTISKYKKSGTRLSETMPDKIIPHLMRQLYAFDELLKETERIYGIFLDKGGMEFNSNSTDQDFQTAMNALDSSETGIYDKFQLDSRFSQVAGTHNLTMRLILDDALKFQMMNKYAEESGKVPGRLFMDDIF